ncbi:TadE/TadG family type IV pilus assembly protein [Saccharopolyspora rosea]|uniref:TadE/TadG family type IV pilus assembly protein n=1 Tax=Saccharopolyspora rosea TaxID=524884 RepID=UPI0021D95FC7|nr:TadE/TadG family type IV pilus assembly protein [Saccharopolyspora rosea]
METAVLAAVVLVTLISVVQAGLWWHTRSLCHHAAALGLHAARAYAADPAAGRASAAQFLHRTPNAAADPLITVTGTDREVSVQVSATAPHLLPLPIDFRATQTATGARERFTTPGGSR